jgi:hypothetical protein
LFKIRPQVIELELKNRFKPEPQQAKSFLSVKPTAVGKGKIFFSIFFNFLAELCHSKTFREKKIFSKIFKKPFLAILAMKEASKRFGP